jgi:hypothetical protein
MQYCQHHAELLQTSSESKIKTLLVHVIKVTIKFCALVALLPWKEPLLPIEQEAGLSPELVLMLWGTEKSLLHAGN